MGVNFSQFVYQNCFDYYARPVLIDPLTSQPGAGAYSARCITHSDGIEFPSEGDTLISDQRTTVDIKEDEFAVLPRQGDQIWLPVDDEGPARGPYEITDFWSNNGGEMTLALKRIEQANPVPPVITPVNVVSFARHRLESVKPNLAHRHRRPTRKWPRI